MEDLLQAGTTSRSATKAHRNPWRVRKLCTFLAAVAVLAIPPSAAGLSYAPPKGQVYAGVNDTAIEDDFRDFAELLGKPQLPVVQAFHTWGTDPREALERWTEYRARGVLSISTSRGWGYPAKISPRQIAEGEGDDYLLTLNSRLARSGQITYVRPLAEPNNWHNAYSAVNSNGSSRGAGNSQRWYRKAWRRMVTIVKGGGPRTAIDARLATLGLPPVQQVDDRALPAELAAPQVAFIWCPLVYGSPRTRNNAPARYWPGGAFVDWVGTDTYSRYPAFSYLHRHYRAFRGKPFAIGEWGVWGADDRGFVKRVFKFQRTHSRVRMMIYHYSFVGRGGPMSLFRWPLAAAAARFQMRDDTAFPANVPEYAPSSAPASTPPPAL